MEFSPQLNVIIAPDNDGNSTGKSVFFKALRTAINADFFEPSELVHLISYGETYASSMFELSDGSIGGFRVDNNKIKYTWQESAQDSIEELTAPHPEFLQKMSIVMDSKTKFVLNILDSDEFLFVNSREDTNYSSLKLISDNEVLEDLIPIIEEKKESSAILQSKANLLKLELEGRLSSLQRYNLSELTSSVEYGEALLPLNHKLLQIAEIISLFDVRLIKDLKKVEKMLNLYQSLISIRESIGKIVPTKENHFERYKQILDKYQSLLKIQEGVSLIKQVEIKDLENCEDLLEIYNKLERIYVHNNSISQVTLIDEKKINKYLDYYDKLEKLQKQISSIQPKQLVDEVQLSSLLNLLRLMQDIDFLLKKIKIIDNSQDLERIESELMAWSGQEILCPVKGKVLFFENGCIQCTVAGSACSTETNT